MTRPKKKAQAKPAAWEKMLAHAKKRMTEEEMGKLSLSEALRLAKVLRGLEEGVRGHGRDEKRGSDFGVSEDEGQERQEAALRVIGEREGLGADED